MNLRQLEIFRAVMRHESTIGAAQDLGISQPAVSNGIRHMEDQLGLALFDRRSNRLVPRKEAKILHEKSEGIFQLSRDLDQTIDDLKHDRIGHLRVICTPQMGSGIAPRAITSFRRDHPKVRVVLDVRQSMHVIQSVETGVADIGLALALDDRLDRTVRLEDLGEVDMVCVLPKDHPLTAKEVLTARDFRRQVLIGQDQMTMLGQLVKKSFEQARVPYAPEMEARYSETAFHMAAAGGGVTIVDRLTVQALLGAQPVAIRPFLPTLSVRAKAILSRNHSISGVAETLLRHLRDTAAQMLAEEKPSDAAMPDGDRRQP